MGAKQARRNPQNGIDKKEQVGQEQRTRIKDKESRVSGQQDRARHEKTESRTWAPLERLRRARQGRRFALSGGHGRNRTRDSVTL